MYCPKCSQQQISDEVRFCSRCGFQLQIVGELLKTDGVLADYAPGAPEKASLYSRITSQFGAKLIFLSIILIPFETLLGIPFDTPVFLLISFVLFVIGFAQLTYALIFGDKTPPAKQSKQAKNLNSAESQYSLPSARNASIPIVDIKGRGTGEMVQPPSVTDPTTKLLEINAETNDLNK